MPFVPRTTSDGIINNPYWYRDNPFWQNGVGMPNCTCYAWGRMWELSGIKPTRLAYDNAEGWYPNTPASAFQKSQTPALGAILCLYGPGSYGGHVAIVEAIDGSGNISVSESGYNAGFFWRYATGLSPANNYVPAWAQERNYVFQGFLLPPAYASGSVTWHAKASGGYLDTDPEAIDNARLIYYILYNQGWTLEAVAGLLGNISAESNLNPWRWEKDIILASNDPLIATSRVHGYGLTQFTPAGKYIQDPRAQVMSAYDPNFSDITGDPSDGEAQIYFIDQYADYYPTSQYPETYAQYKACTISPEYCAAAWVYNYERPGSYAHVPTRQALARYWYDLLKNMPLIPPTGKRIKKLPVWMMLRPGYHVKY